MEELAKLMSQCGARLRTIVLMIHPEGTPDGWEQTDLWRQAAGIPGVTVGDEVILLGTSDGLSVDALEHAELANSTPYEILCNISKRVPRRYPS